MPRPFTLHSPISGSIGRIDRKSGRMIAGGVGVAALVISTAYAVSGSIGRIGRIISTYARARGCGVDAVAVCGAAKGHKGLFTRSLQISSLSSLSSLKGCFSYSIQWVGFSGFGFFILPEINSILPILPEISGGEQNRGWIELAGTKSRTWGKV